MRPTARSDLHEKHDTRKPITHTAGPALTARYSASNADSSALCSGLSPWQLLPAQHSPRKATRAIFRGWRQSVAACCRILLDTRTDGRPRVFKNVGEEDGAYSGSSSSNHDTARRRFAARNMLYGATPGPLLSTCWRRRSARRQGVQPRAAGPQDCLTRAWCAAAAATRWLGILQQVPCCFASPMSAARSCLRTVIT
jgi:hypothetical protein